MLVADQLTNVTNVRSSQLWSALLQDYQPLGMQRIVHCGTPSLAMLSSAIATQPTVYWIIETSRVSCLRACKQFASCFVSHWHPRSALTTHQAQLSWIHHSRA